MSKDDKLLRKLKGWVYEARQAARDWRGDAWRCQEAVDGKILTDDERDELLDAGVNPEDINRIFPVTQLMKGMEIVNKQDITAKSRTHKDSEQSQNMTEGISFVLDQNSGEHSITQAFGSQVDAGIGYIRVDKNPDPRQERVRVRTVDWKGVWFDPFAADPWLRPQNTRYMYYNPFVDLEHLTSIYPDKKDDIEEQYKAFAAEASDMAKAGWQDEGELVEEEKLTSTDWVDSRRKRCRPVEMWYTAFEPCLFAVLPDGKAVELTSDMDPMQQYEYIQLAGTVTKATVKKMRVCTFFGDLILDDDYSDLPHDEFDLIPYVGYVDRFGFPYGVPRQIIGQNVEVIKRRAMGLALLKSRRTQIEQGALLDETPAGLEAAHAEINKIDGFLQLKPGTIARGGIKIEEMGPLANGQLVYLQQAEAEIKEISGANDEQMGYDTKNQSGKALGMKQAQSSTISAPLFQNYRVSNRRVGEHAIALIQGEWQQEKVLRVTDRMTGVDRVIELNKPEEHPNGQIVVKNNITEGRFDVVVTDAPQTDTVREQNIQLLSDIIQKAPEEMQPILLRCIMEMTDLPNKESLLEQLKPLFGGTLPMMEDMTKEQIAEQQQQQMEQAQAEEQQAKEFENMATQLNLENLQLQNEKEKVLIAEIVARTENIGVETDIKDTRARIDNYKDGYSLGKEMAGGEAAQ